ncbi:sugar phosphate isomerase/epimerase [Psychromicrobium silvestre]|uniref:Sugar phosphate isomerase/epimerase n=1 Tax=Psychromicrobium silvestre TaxID=1645614 RepID=A0A7Y9S9D5_9MICC|nr:sugar phosphate isomerase/epimerase [Psychromicrobium silvestre]NYE96232.1 sugar phosphate isomerase/epimerase [Psychromicrobium silvestre]
MTQPFQLPLQQLSVQLYSVRRQLEDDLAGTIAKVAELGFLSVEPYNFVALAAPLSEALGKHGLTAPSGHAPLLSSDQDEIFQAAKTLGIGTVIDPFIPEERWKTRADVEQIAAGLNAAAAKGTEYGITVGYHNHWWEPGTEIDGTTALEVLTETLDDAVVLEVDTYWAAVSGQDPAELLRRLGDRVKFIHLKDGPLSTEPLDQLPAGQGKVDIAAVLAAVPALQVGVVEFDDFRGDIFEGLAQSLAYLKADS